MFIAPFHSFPVSGHMLSEKALSNDIETQQPSEEFLAQLLHLCVIDQVTQTVPKSGQKADYIQLYSVQGKIGMFWCRKNRKNRGTFCGA